MKNIIILIIWVWVCQNPIAAQIKQTNQENPIANIPEPKVRTKNDPASQASEKASKLKKTLQLTEEQIVIIEKIELDYLIEHNKINKQKLDSKTKYKKLKNLNTQRLKKFESTLTPEQFKKYRLSFP